MKFYEMIDDNVVDYVVASNIEEAAKLYVYSNTGKIKRIPYWYAYIIDKITKRGFCYITKAKGFGIEHFKDIHDVFDKSAIANRIYF